ncbi:MAG TPA: ABC transporter ATP-binding protein [Candidatus Limnocylindrales bacterium]|nr:ABC transporter ATP-binding protein [Candidatus Limnocylindrales bacterium]
MSALLEVSGLRVNYGVIEAVKGIDFSLTRGKITSLLGANGAGKSTTLLALSGLLRPNAGSIRFDGVELTNIPSHRIVATGLVQVPEGREILTSLTVRENLLLGGYRRKERGELDADLGSLLGLFPRLGERLDHRAGNLSGGEQQMLAVARALMAKPRLLLLDEPSMGLAPLVVQEIFRTLQELNQRGLTIFLVEQNVRQALKIADHAYVMENGKIVLSGASAELLGNPKVIEAYLGA